MVGKISHAVPILSNFWCRKEVLQEKAYASNNKEEPSVLGVPDTLHHAILSKFLVDKKCFLPSIYRVVREKELGNKLRRRALGEPDTEAPLLHAILSKFLVEKHPS